MCYSKIQGNSVIFWSLAVTAQMTHHDYIFLLFELCWVAKIWNKNPIFIYRQLQYYHQCMLFWVCLHSALTKDEWAPFWIWRHFSFRAYSVLIQSLASAETMLVKVPHIKMALWYAFVLKKSSCNSNWCVCIKYICVYERERVYISSGRFKHNNGDRQVIWIFVPLHLKILDCATSSFSAFPQCFRLSSHKILQTISRPNNFRTVRAQGSSAILYFYINKLVGNSIFSI